VVGEGNDYSPIQQSYEIRKLRAENQRLKERLQAARLAHTDDDDDDDGESPDRKGAKAASRAATSRQRRFKTGDRVDNLYFGTPGLANIVSDVSSIVPPGSRVHPLTRLTVRKPQRRESLPHAHDPARQRHLHPRRRPVVVPVLHHLAGRANRGRDGSRSPAPGG
jgi:hypothetical protein